MGQLAASLVIGNLLAVLFWPSGTRIHGRVVRIAALVWAVSAVAGWLFTLSDLRGLPVSGVLSGDALTSLGFRTSAGQAGLVVVAAAITAAVLHRRAPVAALVAALVGVVPPSFVGVVVSTADHRPAVASLVLQVLAVTVGTGAFAALVLRSGHTPADQRAPLVAAATRYGRVALPCVLVAGVATALCAYVILGPTGTGLDSAYGKLIAVLLVVLGGVGWVGWWRGTQTVPALGRGRIDPFVRYARIELLLLSVASGVVVALSRVPSPLESGEAGIVHETAGQQMLGYDLPLTVSFRELALDWRPDVLFLLLCAAAGFGYLALEARAARAGVVWPKVRTASWFAGLAVIAVATSSGVGRYAPVFFSVTIIQHVLLTIVAPLLLVTAAPLTLFVRTGGKLSALRVRFVTSPVAVVVLWAAGLAGTYFTGVFEATRWSYAIDLTVQGYLLVAGYLLFWWIAGPDPRPGGRRSNRARAAVALAAGVAGALVGAVLIGMNGVVGADWYIGLLRVLKLPWPWGSASVRGDQSVGGIVLVGSSVIVFLALAADRLLARPPSARR